MAFITPFVKTVSRYRPPSRALVKASLHPLYDIASVSTYVAYFTSGYWMGPERRDVDIFAVLMALFWNFTHIHDPTIFVFLWIMGGSCEFISKSFMAGGNGVEAEKFFVGVQMGGLMSFVLLVLDLLDVATGF